MKKFLTTVVWIAVLVAALFGIYMVLPEYPQSYVKGLIQPLVDSQAKTRIEQVKSLKNQDVKDTYQNILGTNTNTQCWVYEDQGGGIEKVTFFGRGAQISIQNVDGYDDHFYDKSCSVKFEFLITNNNVTITCYINGEAQDEKIRDVVIQQLYGSTGK
jgi:hypothetical protein